MTNLEYTLELAKFHQEYLRELAKPRAANPAITLFRRWTGRQIVRFGCWLEGHCSEVSIEPVPGAI
jgi:hypothetical protein